MSITTFIVGWLASVGVVVGLIRYLGEKWIDQKFGERLKQFEHEKARELEKLKLEINGIFSRVGRLHEREFKLLPKIWVSLSKADIHLRNCVMSFRNIPELDKYTDEELIEFLEPTKLGPIEKRRIVESSQKTKAYTDMLPMLDAWQAHKSYVEFNTRLQSGRIFIRADLLSLLDALASDMWKFLISVRRRDSTGESAFNGYEKYDNESKTTISKIEKLIHSRLYPDV